MQDHHDGALDQMIGVYTVHDAGKGRKAKVHHNKVVMELAIISTLPVIQEPITSYINITNNGNTTNNLPQEK